MIRKKGFLLQQTILKGFNVEILHDVFTIFNNLAPYAHISFSEYVYAFSSFLPSFIDCEPNEVRLSENRPIRDWRGRVHWYPTGQYSTEILSLEPAALTD